MLAYIRTSLLKRHQTENPGQYLEQYAYNKQIEADFEQRWQRVKWFWATILFEWLFLSGLVVFALLPWPRRHGWQSWAMRWAAVPLIFMLPVYLGYATFSFTSAGPSGGILYPYLVSFLRGCSSNTLDRELIRYVPQVLEPLSPGIGDWMALSGRGIPGPTEMLLFGILAALIIFAIHKIRVLMKSS